MDGVDASLGWMDTLLMLSRWVFSPRHSTQTPVCLPVCLTYRNQSYLFVPGGCGDAVVLPLLPSFWFFRIRSSKDWKSSSELPESSHFLLRVGGAEAGAGQRTGAVTTGEGMYGVLLGLFTLLRGSFSCDAGRLCRVFHVLLMTRSLSSSESLRNTGESRSGGGGLEGFGAGLGVFGLAE